MLDGLQIENKTLFDLVQLQETRIKFLTAKIAELEAEKAAKAPSDFLEKTKGT